MRKFKVKNRQKRKYTRHNQQQGPSQFAPILAGIMPFIIIAIAFAATILMQQNLQEPSLPSQPQIALPSLHLPTFSLTEALRPLQGLPNLLTQPVAYIFGLGALFVESLQNGVIALGDSLLWFSTLLNPRPLFAAIGVGVQGFVQSLGVIGVTTLDGFVRIGELFVQSMATVGGHMAAGAHTVGSMTVEYATRAVTIISSTTVFLFEKTVEFVLVLYYGIVGILTFLGAQIAAFFVALWKLILLPFQMLAGLWMQIKPYFDILMTHFGMAGNDFKSGVNSLNEVGQALQR